jgi:hypothetical protein
LPGAARIPEIADEFFLFGIDADDRLAGPLEGLAGVCNVLELPVSFLAGRRMADARLDFLVVDLQRIVHLTQEPSHGFGADADAVALQFSGDVAGGLARPFQSAHRVARRLVLYERFDSLEDVGRFFSCGLRPAPA